MEVLIIGAPTTGTGTISPQARSFLLAFAQQALARGWTLRHNGEPGVESVMDEARTKEPAGTIEVYALKSDLGHNPGKNADDVTWYDDVTAQRAAMAANIDHALFFGGIPSDQVPGGANATPMIGEYGAFYEHNGGAYTHFMTGFGGNTGEMNFRELVIASDDTATFIDETDPERAAIELIDAMS